MEPLLNLYLDASALVKRYVSEDGSDLIERAMVEAEVWTSCRIVFVETLGPVEAKAATDGDRFLAAFTRSQRRCRPRFRS